MAEYRAHNLARPVAVVRMAGQRQSHPEERREKGNRLCFPPLYGMLLSYVNLTLYPVSGVFLRFSSKCAPLSMPQG